MTRLFTATLALALAVLIAGSAAAHGLLLQARGEANAVVGRVYYSDGSPGAGTYLELRDLASPATAAAASGAADAQGAFRFPATPGRAYAVVAHGEEGHLTEVRLTLAPGARARLAEPDVAATAGPTAPPAWLLIGGLLLLSLPAALWMSRRRRAQP